MILYGLKTIPLTSIPLKMEACSSCGKTGTVRANVFGRQFHIFWIPLFPVVKTGYTQCSHCKQVQKPKEMPEHIKREYLDAKTESKYKLWQFAGLIGILALFGPTLIFTIKLMLGS